MGTGMYLIREDGQLVEMSEQPYDSEDLLQGLLARYPNLLAGDQMNGASPRRWLLISREAGLPSENGGTVRWSVDHLFLDQDGIPTLVEVKRSSDTRIRREVVGQMLDYAANAVVYWPVDALRATFEARCQAEGAEPDQVIAAALGRQDADDLWEQVRTNLQAGKVRLVFVADVIPPELQRIVEFLNGQMSPAEVLAVEIKQYVGQSQRTLIPRVMGQTAVAEKAKGTASSPSRQWNEESFFEDLVARRPPEEVAAARHLYTWAQEHVSRLWWGKGKRDGSCNFMLDHEKQQYWLVALWTSGHVEIPFQYILSSGPFADDAKRLEYLNRLNSIPGIAIPPDKVSGSPFLPLARFVDDAALQQLIAVLDWAVAEIKASW